jgi:hypothetical protein
MKPFWIWWNALPEGYRTAIVAGLVAGVGWVLVRGIPSLAKVVVAFRKRKHEKQIELLSHRVWAYIKAQPGSATTATRTSAIVNDLKVSESDAKEALRALKDKGLLRTTFDEGLWYSDAKGRFFN